MSVLEINGLSVADTVPVGNRWSGGGLSGFTRADFAIPFGPAGFYFYFFPMYFFGRLNINTDRLFLVYPSVFNIINYYAPATCYEQSATIRELQINNNRLNVARILFWFYHVRCFLFGLSVNNLSTPRGSS